MDKKYSGEMKSTKIIPPLFVFSRIASLLSNEERLISKEGAD